ncbi:DUF421 domain-containing protein [Adhaeribacter swui]|uniref:DUF421 domain-containing protein n=1 Tax=Adhaeribacter swui TaxID=2086471 RepID=A0A7G7G8R2_9BACT|nr:YetF domain-containing protein [Adhaeribacter swui]QNF33546.1 DUF421 domain-containing protein [Adhaeribacter swui]
MEETFRHLIGPDSNAINWWQMCIRGSLVFFLALVLIRIGDRRIFSKNAAFDIVMSIILGSVLSRAVTGNAPFVPTIITSVALVALHWVLALVAQKHHRFGILIKGQKILLVKDGQVQEKNMRKQKITIHDLHEMLRLNGKTTKIEEVQEAYLERSGNVSVIIRNQKP